jgi:hypothetical protein
LDPDPLARLAHLLSAGPFLRRIALLVPDRARLFLLREQLFRKAGDLLCGVYFFTPQFLREKLLLLSNFSLNPLPANCLIPLQIRGGHGPIWSRELCRLRPGERDKLFPGNSLRQAEAAGFFTEKAIDCALLDGQNVCHWDFACSFGFSEGDWDSWHILKCLSNSAKATHHFFIPQADVTAVRRWRECWGYVVADRTPSAQVRYPLFHAGDWDSAAELLGQRLLTIAETDPPQPVAIVFSRANGYYRTVRELLKKIRIPFLDLFSPSANARTTQLQWTWLRYQMRPKRRELRELLRAFSVENGWTCDALGRAENAILEHCRRNLCDDCDAVPDLPFAALPDRGPVEELFELTCRFIPGWEPLRDRIPILGALYENLTREEFLAWLEREVANLHRPEEDEPLARCAPVHLIPYAAATENFYGHLILADTAAENFSISRGEILSDEICGQINGTVKDFYYVPPEEQAVLRDFLLIRSISAAPSCEGIFVERDNIFSGGDFYSIAPVLSGFFERKMVEKIQIRPEMLAAGSAIFPSIADTVVAHKMRRDPSEAFGAYDFGFGENLCGVEEWSAAIPCKAWERILKTPEKSWFEQVLRLPIPNDSIREDLPQLLGTAVHQALANHLAGREIAEIAGEVRSTMARSMNLQIAGFTADLLSQAKRLQKNFRPSGEYCETSLRGTVTIAGNELDLHGRSDWLLRDCGGRTLIVDFKTGSPAGPFTVHGICGGDFLQLALYGRIVEKLFGPCAIAALFPFSRMKYLSMEELSENSSEEIFSFWDRFGRLWNSLNCGYQVQRARKFLAFSLESIPDHIIVSRIRASGLGSAKEEEQ